MRLFRRRSRSVAPTGFIEILHIRMSLQESEFGTSRDRHRIDKIIEDCTAILTAQEARFNGDSYGRNEATISFTCPNAVQAWLAVRSTILSNFQLMPVTIGIEHHLQTGPEAATTEVVTRRRKR
ncbi:MAG: hypothetical protein ACOCXA_04380 [Planctomycetota bacterium]